ncbi:P60-like protein [Hesseltinella vesiculosa]|uniref:Ribosome biogenesis protein NOP53 n=1 Tax=Hesseltinella vesiculosa TaxID=101127 RepID=A0A1X2GNF1_9FUNG|nr:P60-like protein [Hesseltinella vesiculosa]
MAPVTVKEKQDVPVKKQTSRKGKKAWRKNIDVEEMETGLEALRSEERVRGTQAELPDEAHFILDDTGDAQVAKEVRKQRTLKVDEILAERSAVPAVKSGRFVHDKPTQKSGELSKTQTRQVNKLFNRKAKGQPLKPKKKSHIKSTYDLWDAPSEATQPTSDFIEKPTKVKAPATMSMIPKVTQHVSAVVVPQAGASYNPTEADHHALVQHAADIEFKKIKEAMKVDSKLARISASTLPDEHDLKDENEVEDEEEDAEEESDTEQDGKTGKRKTTAQRNREKRRRTMLADHADKQTHRRIGQQITHVASTIEALDEKDKIIEESTLARQAHKELREKQGLKTVGSGRVMQPNVEVQLEEELSESLRQLKPEGNMFMDRFASLQQRNIIVPPSQNKNPKRRYALKVYERRSYKNFDLKEAQKQKRKQRN